jgi:hypothetical protein
MAIIDPFEAQQSQQREVIDPFETPAAQAIVDPFGEPAPKPSFQPSSTAEGMAGYVPRRAPTQTDTSKPAPYKTRREALADAVNLLEEGVDQTELKDAFAKMGVPWEEIIAYGQKRGSEYFKQATPTEVAKVSKAIPTGTIQASPEPGWLEGTANLFKRVDANLGDTATGLLLQTGGIKPDQAGRVIASNAKRRAAAMPDSETRAQMEKIGKAKTYGEAASALWNNKTATMTMLVESVITSLPMMAPGLIVGGPAGAVMTGLASGGMEYGSVITDVLQDKGVDLLNPNAISDALNNPKIMEEIKDKGAKRGLIVGGFDAITMGLAGRFLKPAKDLIAAGKLTGTAAKKATVAAWSKELSMQMGGGAGGEFAAQKATGDNKPVDVIMEALAETVTGPLDVRSNLRESAKLEKQAAFIPSAEQIARSKGFLASEGKPPSKIEPTLDDAALLAAAPVEGEKLPRPFDDVEKTKLEQIVKRLLDSGQPADSAQRIAAKQVLEERKKIISELVTEPTEDEIEQRVKELIDEGIPPQEALNLAPVQIMEERKADALAQAENQGEQNVRQTIAEPSGDGVSMAGQSDPNAPAGGTGIAEPSGVVPVRQDVAGVAAGETVQPVAVVDPFEQKVSQDNIINLDEQRKQRIAEIEDAARAKWNVGLFNEALQNQLRVLTDLHVKGIATDEDINNFESAIDNSDDSMIAVAKIGKLLAPLKKADRAAEQQRIETPAANEEATTEQQAAPQEAITEPAAEEVAPQEAAPAESAAKSDDVIAEEAKISDDVADIVGDITNLPAEETTAPKGKRGPKKGARQTPEQKAASDERRKQQTKNYKQNVKAVAAAEAALNDSLTDLKAENYGSDTELQEGVESQRIKKIQAIKSLVLLDRALKGTTLGKRVAELLKNPEITAQELENVKKGIAAQISKSDKQTKVGRADTRFNGMTTGQQALRHVIKTGNAFQKFLAQRLLPFVKDVKFMVLEEGAPLPSQITEAGAEADWAASRGMFLRIVSTGERFVFVLGATGGPSQGINNITVLHEMLHAALNKKMDMADWALRSGFDRNSDLAKAFRGLQKTIELTQQRMADMQEAGTLPESMIELVGSGIFDDPREFVAYAMSDPAFQKFLMETEGNIKQPLLTRFVNNVRQFFNMGAMHTSALADVITLTDTMLSERMTPLMREEIKEEQRGAQVSSQLKSEGENEFGDPIRSAKELKEDGLIAEEKVRMSRQGEEGGAIEDMQRARDEQKVLSVLQALVKRNWQNMTYPAIETLVTLPTFTFLTKWSGIKSMNDVEAHLQSMLGMSNSLQAGAQKILFSLKKELNPLFRSAKEFRAKFEDFVYETTLARVDPSDPKALERIPALDAKWKALGPKGQRMYRMLKQYYADIIDLYTDLLDQQIQSIQGMSAEGKKNLTKTLRAAFETGARIRPYFPLVRRGDFWLRIEEKVGKDTKQAFYMFETVGERDERAAELAAERRESLEELRRTGRFDSGENVGTLRAATQNASALLTQIFDAIDKEDFGSPESKDALKDAIYQVYLNTMPEQSFRSQFIHRKDRAGFSTDVLRNVATTASKTSMQLARLKYSPLLRNSLSAARDAAKSNSNLSPFIEEAQRRVNLALTGNQEGFWNAVAGIANKVSYFWFLSGASSALIQPASIYIAGLPVLGANHNNVAAAAKELGKMVVLMNQYSVLRENADGTTSMVAPSIANNTSLPEHERNAIREMSQRGVAQSTYASEVYGYKSTSTREASTVLGKTKELGVEAADLLIGGLMHNIERLTREAVFLASYRLGVKRGLTEDAAINQAVDDVNEALANYDITNRPRFMQQGIGKIALQFKMFPLHTALLLCTNFIKMMPLLNKEGKKAAAIKFFGITMTAGSVAGMAGLPFGFLGVIAAAFKHMQDEDDDFPDELKDKDSKAWFRNVFLPQKLGDVTIGGVPVSELLDTGPLNALTGTAVAERIGLQDLFSRDTKEAKTESEAIKEFAFEKMGPTASVALSFADAYDAYLVGDYQKMREKLAPAVARNLLLAHKMATEGIKDSKGNVVFNPDDISTGRILAQMIGFRPAVVARMSEVNFKLTGVEQSTIFERDRLLLASKIAIRKGTPEGDAQFQKLIETKIDAFNQKHPDYEIDVDSDEFEESLEKDLESRAEAQLGFKITEKNAAMASPALEQLEKRIARERAAIKKSKE